MMIPNRAKFKSFVYIGGGDNPPTCAMCGDKATFTGCSDSDCVTRRGEQMKNLTKNAVYVIIAFVFITCQQKSEVHVKH